MGKIDIGLIKKLREETGVAFIRIREVLEDVKGSEKEALVILKKEGLAKAEKREGRVTSQGKIFVYTHHTGKVVGVVELLCETDFVAKNELFENLGREVAMQAASMGEVDLEKQDFIKDPSKKVLDLVKEVIAKTGENIRIGRVFRVELGK
ncbi:MAG: elongation factor Ts [Candidatus Woesebacteria bacterium]|nr:MAG: elongation factor Ts [Candidatus Woesebacteria bacterium]